MTKPIHRTPKRWYFHRCFGQHGTRKASGGLPRFYTARECPVCGKRGVAARKRHFVKYRFVALRLTSTVKRGYTPAHLRRALKEKIG